MKDENKETKETITTIDDRIDWYQFAPVRDYFLTRTVPSKSNKETETGIILQVEESVVMDRPNVCEVISVGPESKYDVGEIVFIQKQSGYELNNIRKPSDAEYTYLLLHTDAVIGKLCKDTRK